MSFLINKNYGTVNNYQGELKPPQWRINDGGELVPASNNVDTFNFATETITMGPGNINYDLFALINFLDNDSSDKAGPYPVMFNIGNDTTVANEQLEINGTDTLTIISSTALPLQWSLFIRFSFTALEKADAYLVAVSELSNFQFDDQIFIQRSGTIIQCQVNSANDTTQTLTLCNVDDIVNVGFLNMWIVRDNNNWTFEIEGFDKQTMTVNMNKTGFGVYMLYSNTTSTGVITGVYDRIIIFNEAYDDNERNIIGAISGKSLNDYLQNARFINNRTIDMNGNAVINVAEPATAQDAATRNYVDTTISSELSVYEQQQLYGSTNNVIVDTSTDVIDATGTNEIVFTAGGLRAETFTVSGTEYMTIAGTSGAGVRTNWGLVNEFGEIAFAMTGNTTRMRGFLSASIDVNTTADFPADVTASDFGIDSDNIYINKPLDAGSNVITNLADPTSAQDASTRNYVDTNVLWTKNEIPITLHNLWNFVGGNLNTLTATGSTVELLGTNTVAQNDTIVFTAESTATQILNSMPQANVWTLLFWISITEVNGDIVIFKTSELSSGGGTNEFILEVVNSELRLLFYENTGLSTTTNIGPISNYIGRGSVPLIMSLDTDTLKVIYDGELLIDNTVSNFATVNHIYIADGTGNITMTIDSIAIFPNVFSDLELQSILTISPNAELNDYQIYNIISKTSQPLDMNSRHIINIADPINAQDAATKDYVETSIANNRYTELVDNTGTTAINTATTGAIETADTIEIFPGADIQAAIDNYDKVIISGNHMIDTDINITRSNITICGTGHIDSSTGRCFIISGAVSDITISGLTLTTNQRVAGVEGLLSGLITVLDGLDQSNIKYIGLTIRANRSGIIHDNTAGSISNMIVSGCHITCTSTEGYGIAFRKKINGLRFTDNIVDLSDVNSYNNVAIYAGTTNFVCSNNICIGGGHSPIACSPANNGIINGNRCIYTGTPPTDEAGIEIEWKTQYSETSHDIVVSNNHVEGYYWGIFVAKRESGSGNPYNIKITGNYIKNCADYNIRVGTNTYNIDITDNTIIAELGKTSIRSDGLSSNINNNHIITSGTTTDSAISIGVNTVPISNVIIANNKIDGSGIGDTFYAIDIKEATDNIKIMSNVISNCENGINLSAPVYLHNNLFETVVNKYLGTAVSRNQYEDVLDMNSNAITNLSEPTNTSDAATKAYVESWVPQELNDGVTTVVNTNDGNVNVNSYVTTFKDIGDNKKGRTLSNFMFDWVNGSVAYIVLSSRENPPEGLTSGSLTIRGCGRNRDVGAKNSFHAEVTWRTEGENSGVRSGNLKWNVIRPDIVVKLIECEFDGFMSICVKVEATGASGLRCQITLDGLINSDTFIPSLRTDTPLNEANIANTAFKFESPIESNTLDTTSGDEINFSDNTLMNIRTAQFNGQADAGLMPALLRLTQGQSELDFNESPQISFGYNGGTNFQHFITTTHNSGAENNSIHIFTCTGTSNNTLTNGSNRVWSFDNQKNRSYKNLDMEDNNILGANNVTTSELTTGEITSSTATNITAGIGKLRMTGSGGNFYVQTGDITYQPLKLGALHNSTSSRLDIDSSETVSNQVLNMNDNAIKDVSKITNIGSVILELGSGDLRMIESGGDFFMQTGDVTYQPLRLGTEFNSSTTRLDINSSQTVSKQPLSMNTTNKIINLAEPDNLQDAATKNYVDTKTTNMATTTYVDTTVKTGGGKWRTLGIQSTANIIVNEGNTSSSTFSCVRTGTGQYTISIPFLLIQYYWHIFNLSSDTFGSITGINEVSGETDLSVTLRNVNGSLRNNTFFITFHER